MPGSAATRSAGRLHPRNRAPSLRRVFYVLVFVVALLGASEVIFGTPWAASASKPQCNNRIDDDSDGKIDYPADPGCTGRGDKSEVDPLQPPPAPPPSPFLPPAPDTYFNVDYSSQEYRMPWTTLFSYSAPGFVDLNPATGGGPATQTPDGRVRVVPDPAGGGGFVSRHEIRNSDPHWASSPTIQKAEVRTVAEKTFNRPGGLVVGDVRWFTFHLYLPYTASEKFEWASGGSNAFNEFMDIHPGAAVSQTISLQWYGGSNSNVWARLRMENPAPTVNYNLWQLTDSGGNRVMANHNRWLSFVLGVKFAPDNTGWIEAWVDGVNVLPRTNRQTMVAGDIAEYLKYGLYKQVDASYPSGASVIYFGPTYISLSNPLG